jgi:hypothetical protein
MRCFGVAVRRNTKHCNDLLSDISNVDGFNSKVAHGLAPMLASCCDAFFEEQD